MVFVFDPAKGWDGAAIRFTAFLPFTGVWALKIVFGLNVGA
ncbi:MAG TPA: hypothetical protein VIM16_16955 [Mucilaginibacter sp.]